MKIAWQNCYSIGKAEVVFFGAESQEGSLYKGTRHAPNEIRAASNKMLSGQTLQGKRFVLQPQGGAIKKRVFDAYNIEKEEIAGFVEKIAGAKKIPAMAGGDHSNTLEALNGLSRVFKSFSIVYLDSHLDMVGSQGRFYGSVLHDASKIRQLKLKKSACIGCRAFREEEYREAKKAKLLVIPAVELEELGVKKVFQRVRKRAGKRAYLSVDIDVVEPGNAPGVSDPVPGGLTPNQLISLSKMIAHNGIIGFDVMEISPPQDQMELTVSLGAKLVSEVIGSIR